MKGAEGSCSAQTEQVGNGNRSLVPSDSTIHRPEPGRRQVSLKDGERGAKQHRAAYSISRMRRVDAGRGTLRLCCVMRRRVERSGDEW